MAQTKGLVKQLPRSESGIGTNKEDKMKVDPLAQQIKDQVDRLKVGDMGMKLSPEKKKKERTDLVGSE